MLDPERTADAVARAIQLYVGRALAPMEQRLAALEARLGEAKLAERLARLEAAHEGNDDALR